MIKDLLEPMTQEQLQETLRRLSLSIDDLEFLLEELTTEGEELQSTNAMLKQTLTALEPSNFNGIVERAKRYVREKLERWNKEGKQAIYPKYDEFEVVEGQDQEEWGQIVMQLGESLPHAPAGSSRQ
jgi:hypothetical protein